MSVISAILMIVSAPFWFFGLMFFLVSPWATATVNGVPSPKDNSFAKIMFAVFGLVGFLIASLLTFAAFSI